MKLHRQSSDDLNWSYAVLYVTEKYGCTAMLYLDPSAVLVV